VCPGWAFPGVFICALSADNWLWVRISGFNYSATHVSGLNLILGAAWRFICTSTTRSYSQESVTDCDIREVSAGLI